MARVTLPSVLRSLRSITAAEVKAMYQAIADVLNGGLDARNFSPHLRIPNAVKNEPRSIFALTGWHREWVGGQVQDEVFFRVPDGIKGTIKVAGFSATAAASTATTAPPYVGSRAAGTPPTASTIQLRRRTTPPGGPGILAAASLSTLAAERGPVAWCSASCAAEVEVQPGEILSVFPASITHGTGMTRLVGVCASVWLRCEHLP
jgi:hypothetical protein